MDEAAIAHDGINNTHNWHVWSDENPHATVKSDFRCKFSLSVWCGTLDDSYLIGAFIFENRFTYHYLIVLQDQVQGASR